MTGRHILGAIGVAAVAVVALLAFAWRPAIAPIAPPSPTSFPRELVETGETLASAGNCIDCHTAPGGTPTPAASRSTRRSAISTRPTSRPIPRPASAPGPKRPSPAPCARACRATAPPFPGLSLHALHAAHRRRCPRALRLLHDPAAGEGAEPAQHASFPLDVRPLQAVWKSIFFKPGPYRPDPGRDPRWNRGAYLAEALAGCAVCHTDRNLLGAQQVGHPYAGALIDGWYATSLDISPSPARWSEEEFFAYLRRGDSPPHGVALGPMRAVVRNLVQDIGRRPAARWPPTSSASTRRPARRSSRGSPARSRLSRRPPTSSAPGTNSTWRIARAATARPAAAPPVARSPLGLSEALWNPYRAYNLLLTVLDGIDGRDGLPGNMPGFRDKLSDDDIEALAVYLRASHTTMPPGACWPTGLR